jgi:hypothetical protein
MPLNPTGTINLTTGQILGSIRLNYPFEFILGSTAPSGDVEVTGEDNNHNDYAWFSGGSATIPHGQTTVTVTATEATNGIPWFTYTLTGMVGAQNVHVVVSVTMDVPKAS